MARAKSTERAEARRKYRAYLQQQEEAADAAEGSTDEPGSTSTRGRDIRPMGPSVGPARLSIFAAAKAAYRTPHYIDDIKSAPALIFKTNAIWPVLVICIISGTVWSVQATRGGGDEVTKMIVQFMFYPAPLLPPMIAGFFAVRASWLAGLIASFIATVTLVTVLGISSLTLPSNAASGSTIVSSLSTFFVSQLAQALPFGVLMGALSAWYKRFLSLTSGPKRPPSPRSGGKRSAQRRRPATRS